MDAHRLEVESLRFRFFGDFTVEINSRGLAGLSARQLTLLRFIAACPSTVKEVAQMALETDLASLTGAHFAEKYSGPSDIEILDSVLNCLPASEQTYWENLRSGPGDCLHNEIMPVFFAFRVKLNRTGLEDISATHHALKSIGPTIDSSDI